MPTLKEFLVNNGLVLLTVVTTLVVNLNVLEAKFETQASSMEDNKTLLSGIQKELKENTLTLNDLRNADNNLSNRLLMVEKYIPESIVVLEKGMIALTKDYEMLEFKVGSYHPKPSTP